MSELHDCGEQAAAYVLGALEPAEAEAFREHLQSCAVCRAEVKSLGAVIDVLPMSVAQYAPPARLGRRVRAEIRAYAGARRAPAHLGARLRRPVIAGFAVLVLACVALLGVVLSPGPSHPSTRVYAASVGDARVSVSGERARLIVNHLPQPKPGRIYEVWLERGGSPKPAGALFGVNARGRAEVVVPGTARGITAVLVTSEPAGGSPAPTRRPVIVTDLT